MIYFLLLLLPFFFPWAALHIAGKRVLNSSCGGVVFLSRMINEGCCPQKPEVFFLIRQAMLIKLLKCSLITGSPLIPPSFFYTVCGVSSDVMSYVFFWVGGGVVSSAQCTQSHLSISSTWLSPLQLSSL